MALGKGLSSLIPEESLVSLKNAFIPDLPINSIVPNTYQPRVEMDPDKLTELADSIREHGVIEPLIVTKQSANKYELIAGERRWRASKLAGIKKLPVVVKEASPQQMLELAIVENIQREDLNPLEEALSFEHLAQKFNLTHQEISKKVGYSRPAVANKIRLLQLPDDIKKGLLEGKISEGHARTLLGLENEEAMTAAFKVITRDDLSVRATEKLVQKLKNELVAQNNSSKKTYQKLSSEYVNIQKDFTKSLKTAVKITVSSNGGKVIIPFKDLKQLEEIKKHLS